MVVSPLSMNYTLNRTSKDLNNYYANNINKSKSSITMPFNFKSNNQNAKTIVGLEIKPSREYKGCGSCGRG